MMKGCVNSSIDTSYATDITLMEDEKIVLLGRRHESNYETEESFVACVGKVLRKKNVSVLPEDEFINAMFPWFEPRVAPISVNDLSRLINRPAVAAKIKDNKIRYLVWLDGNTYNSDAKGSMSCAISPFGGGCFGLVSWEQKSDYEVAIWDMHNNSLVGNMSSNGTGTSYMPAVFFPIPLVASVKNNLCKGLGREIEKIFTNASPPKINK